MFQRLGTLPKKSEPRTKDGRESPAESLQDSEVITAPNTHRSNDHAAKFTVQPPSYNTAVNMPDDSSQS